MGDLCCDAILKETWIHLCEDLEEGSQINAHRFRGLTTQGIRDLKFPEYLYSDIHPYTVKCVRQISQFFDRYRFKDDVLTDSDLECVAYDKFVGTQERIAAHDWNPRRASTMIIVRRARRICRMILGDVPSDEEIFRNGSFSKRATKFSPLNKSYFHEKLKLITGSLDHLSWFRRGLSQDPLLDSAIEAMGGTYQEVRSLNVSFVPKSWKTFRTVTPNSLVGSFWSHGIGQIVEQRLRGVGLNINTLQERQKLLAKQASFDTYLATGDLSAASDSFSSTLMNMILPRGWYNLLKFGRVPWVTIENPRTGKNQDLYMASFMAMGIGYTFPVQTLIFYCLLRAIKEELGIHGTVSVYGDDLIYPRKIHKYVSAVFSDLGFLFNLDKSFARGNFRESCGGDYYKEVDVRPAMVDFHHTPSSHYEFLSCIHKLYNALKLRWTEHELPSTFSYLERIVEKLNGYVYVVPPCYPDEAGFKFHDIPSRFLDKVKMVRKKSGTFWLAFTSLTVASKGLPIRSEEQLPYLWLKLSLLDSPHKDPSFKNSDDQLWMKPILQHNKKSNTYYTDEASNILYWKNVPVKVRGRKFKKFRAFSSLKNVKILHETGRSVMDWTT